MIDVEQVFQAVRELSTKGKGGYVTTDEHNRNSKRAELMLWQFYATTFERTGMVPDAMFPFLNDEAIALDADGAFAVPDSFGHRVHVQYASVHNADTCGEAPGQVLYPTLYLQQRELLQTLSSPIRRPNLTENVLYHAFRPDQRIQVYPEKMVGVAHFRYLRYPTYAVRAYTVDSTNDEQAYNAGGSTHYEWQAQEENNLVDLLLLFVGIITRDSQLLQWAGSRQSLTPNVVH